MKIYQKTRGGHGGIMEGWRLTVGNELDEHNADAMAQEQKAPHSMTRTGVRLSSTYRVAANEIRYT